MRYAVVIENAGTNFSAYVPDLPGCIATGASRAEAEAALREAIEFHLEGLREDGMTVPAPASRVDYVDVATPAKAARKGPDSRSRDAGGEVRHRRGDTLVRTLRQEYGDNFLKKYRPNTKLETVLKREGVDSFSQLDGIKHRSNIRGIT